MITLQFPAEVAEAGVLLVALLPDPAVATTVEGAADVPPAVAVLAEVTREREGNEDCGRDDVPPEPTSPLKMEQIKRHTSTLTDELSQTQHMQTHSTHTPPSNTIWAVNNRLALT